MTYYLLAYINMCPFHTGAKPGAGTLRKEVLNLYSLFFAVFVHVLQYITFVTTKLILALCIYKLHHYLIIKRISDKPIEISRIKKSICFVDFNDFHRVDEKLILMACCAS